MKRFLFRINFISLIIFGCSAFVQAKHIIGGEMTYRCLGNNQYEFTLRVYKDKFCTGCADIDPQASIAIYKCNISGGVSPCIFQNQNTTFQRFLVSHNPIFEIFPPDYPCVITPPNIVVEVGVYQFTTTLPPTTNESYHAVYQRCCRNETITNIFDPDDAGATYSVEITPEAQRTCNNSPTFKKFPPTVICADFPFEFDHSATDAEGDSLIYTFCEPILGGGNNQVNSASCAGTQPTPPCPPPYGTVDYRVPTYTGAAPVSGTPPLSIDPKTGIITGHPNAIGQYLVGVCVYEYRNGNYIGKISRDFQFNVVACTATVVADIEADSTINGERYFITSCGQNTIEFINKSYQRNYISTFRWEFPGGTPNVSIDWNASITFPTIGKYFGKLYLNAGSPCADTTDLEVNIFPAIDADFSYAYDTCKAGEVSFTDLSRVTGSQISRWNWDFNVEGYSLLKNPRYLFVTPGLKNVVLAISDQNNCRDTVAKVVSYFPIPEVLLIQPSRFEGCAPMGVQFNNLSSPVDESYQIKWDFGDGKQGTGLRPFHEYEKEGTYNVRVDLTSPIGCKIGKTFNSFIKVRPSPTADFDYSPKSLSKARRTVKFTDLSMDAKNYLWNFGTGFSTMEINPEYTFPDTGIYKVALVVTNTEGCKDTLIKYLDVVPGISYFLPNAFTPNNDSKNDEFIGVGEYEGIHDFEMTIWNRWGEMVFITKDPYTGWNGRKNNQGEMSPNGVYICLVKFKNPRGKEEKLEGFATLIR